MMRIKIFTILVFLAFSFACNRTTENYSENMASKPESKIKFDQSKWKVKDGKDYPYREQMLNDILYNDTIRTLNKDEILYLLGEPTYYRDNENYLYYVIDQKRIFSWPLHTKAMVIKFSDDSTMDWIKVHE